MPYSSFERSYKHIPLKVGDLLEYRLGGRKQRCFTSRTLQVEDGDKFLVAHVEKYKDYTIPVFQYELVGIDQGTIWISSLSIDLEFKKI